MSQPLGFVDSNYPTHVCKLKKALHGLKQAPKAWYNELKLFLLSKGFVNAYFDTSLFIYRHGGCCLYLLVKIKIHICILKILCFCFPLHDSSNNPIAEVNIHCIYI